MAARNWMLVQAEGLPSELLKNGPALDREASAALARRLFPDETLEAMADASLDQAHPPNDVLLVGCYPGLTILAAKEFSADQPSQLDRRFIDTAPGRTVYLHALHSGVDWFAYAVWRAGALQRALSLSPDSGLQDDVGEPLPFEQPFWQGQHPPVKVVDEFDDEEDDEPYPLPFQPLALGEAALQAFFGYQIEGVAEDSGFDPAALVLLRFRRSERPSAGASQPWWKRLLGGG